MDTPGPLSICITNMVIVFGVLIFLAFVIELIHVDQFDDKSQKNKNTKYDNHVSDTNGKWAWSIHE